MHKLWAAAAAVLVAVGAAFAAAAGATSAVATGDTCVANGTGTQYTLTVMLPAGAPQQDGFAVGVKGGSVTKLSIGGIPGKASTSGLPAGTQQAWLGSSPQGVPGAEVPINIHASIANAKSFTVVPYDMAHQTWFDAFACPVSKLANPATAAGFTVSKTFAYNTATRSWGVAVTVPAAGTVNVSQNGGTKQFIFDRRTKVSRAGTARLSLVPTSTGRTTLAKGGMLRVKLSVEFSPASGEKPMTRTMAVTLHS